MELIDLIKNFGHSLLVRHRFVNVALIVIIFLLAMRVFKISLQGFKA